MTLHHFSRFSLHRQTGALSLMVLLMAALGVASCEQDRGRTYRANVNAAWIGISSDVDTIQAGEWLCYHKLITAGLEDLDTIYITADTKYWLWVNEKLVVREGGLPWGPVPGGAYTDAVDLSDFAGSGELRLDVAVWYWGRDGFAHQSGPAAALRISSSTAAVVTDTSWSVAKHPALSPRAGGPYPNYRLAASHVLFDGSQKTLADADACLWGYDGPWSAAVVHTVLDSTSHEESIPSSSEESQQRTSSSTGYNHTLRPIAQWKDFGRKPYPQAPEMPLVSDGTPLTLDLPYNAQVTAYLDVTSATGGDTITMMTDNFRGGGAYNYKAAYITGPGRQVYQMPNWINGHQMIYDIPADVTVHDLQYRETGYATEIAGSFHSDDPLLDELWTKAARTLYITMRDNYMDCPDRERAQWWGDVVIELEETMYALDRESDRLTRKALLELMHWQKADSSLFSPIPAGNWDKELPTQMLASVGKYGLWTYYLHTGDERILHESHAAVKRYLHLYELDSTGMVIPRQGGWTWGDWGDNKDLPLLFAGWYALALESYADMSGIVGDPDEALWADERWTSLSRAVQSHWTGSAYKSSEHTGPPDGRAQALMVLSGMAPASHEPALISLLAEEKECSPYFEKYVLEALYRLDQPDIAIDRMRSRYREMIESPLTTLWEGWSLNDAKWGGGTYNHAWSGGPLSLLSGYALGVQPVSPGYDTIHIRPQLGPLRRASGSLQSPHGEITISIHQSDDGLQVTYDVPSTIHVIEEY